MWKTSISQSLWRQQHPNLYHPALPPRPSRMREPPSVSCFGGGGIYIIQPFVRLALLDIICSWRPILCPVGIENMFHCPVISHHQQCIGLQVLDMDVLRNLAFVIVSCLANVLKFLIHLVPEFVAFVLQNYFALHSWWVNERPIWTCKNSHH